MVICRAELEDAELFYVPPNVPWHIISRCDGFGNSYLTVYIGLERKEINLCFGRQIMCDYPGLDADAVPELFDAMVGAIAQRLSKGEVHCINIPEIQDKLLPVFLRRWQEEGLYVPET